MKFNSVNQHNRANKRKAGLFISLNKYYFNSKTLLNYSKQRVFELWNILNDYLNCKIDLIY